MRIIPSTFFTMRAWYMDNINENQRIEHHRDPPVFLSLDRLYKLTGVEYFKLEGSNYTEDPELQKLKKERCFSYEDEICISPETLCNYDEKLHIFYSEHLHTDDEIRLVLEGSGYFDVRDVNDEWIRIHVEPGDLLVIPRGIYHRFTPDIKDYIKAKRYFVGEPVWTPHNRPADDMESRKLYVEQARSGFHKL